jgi:hypothetical protein
MESVSLNIIKKLVEGTEVNSNNVETFNQILTEWDFIQGYTNGDVVDPHIECIEVNGDNIHVECEIWDPDVDDYVFCSGGDFKAPEIISMLDKADFDHCANVYEVAAPIYKEVEKLIDWDKVSNTLFDLRDNELNIQEK